MSTLDACRGSRRGLGCPMAMVYTDGFPFVLFCIAWDSICIFTLAEFTHKAHGSRVCRSHNGCSDHILHPGDTHKLDRIRARQQISCGSGPLPWLRKPPLPQRQSCIEQIVH